MDERLTKRSKSNMASNPSHFCRVVRMGRMAEVEEILKRQPDVIDSPDDPCGYTPLHYAASRGHTSIAELLIRAGSRSLDAPSRNGSCPLHLAASAGHKSMVKLLIQSGSQSLDTPGKNGRTPLHYAAEKGHKSVVSVLLQFGSQSLDSPDKNGKTPSQYTATLKQL